MQKNKRVAIKNEANCRVVLSVKELRINLVFEQKGVTKFMTFGDLQDAMYNSGVQYLFKNGVLSIDDLEVKKALGLEPEDATKPVNIIILDDDDKEWLWKGTTVADFRKEVGKLNIEQVRGLADYGVEREYMDIERNEIIKNVIGTDVISAIRLNRQQKEPTNTN